ncbi:hypothetical protein [Halomonas sp.]|uniref:hypothetical protein n=1 Tax=Halomonas sp. TaxID=1486246 RepID=UPI0026298C1D|nr:hypothetical protein [Halomonas sp.]
MTPTDIVMETGALSLEDAIGHTRWAIREQAPTVLQIQTERGIIVLSQRERADLRAYLANLLARRLEILEGPL